MIIDDDRIFRESIQSLIDNSDGLTCPFACTSCEAALEILNGDFVPEVILLDIQLPGINGIEGIRGFRKVTPATHIIMLTVFDDDDLIFNAICLGAEGYLLKSATPEQIRESIRNVLHGGAAMTPVIAAKVLRMFTREMQPNGDYNLTRREKELLQLLVEGMSKKHIAGSLNLSPHTIDTHLKNIYAKLHVHSQIDMVSKTLREHLI